MPSPEIRKGMPPVKVDRQEFERRFKSRFVDPAFAPLEQELREGRLVAAGTKLKEPRPK